MKDFILKSNFDLEARIFVPKNVKKGVVLAHSFRNTMDKPLIVEAQEEFGEKGFATILFNFLGHGNSGGRMRDVTWTKLGENISDMIIYLKQCGCETVGVFATSFSSIASIFSKERPDTQIFINPNMLYNPTYFLNKYLIELDLQEDVLLKPEGYCIVGCDSSKGAYKLGKEWILEMRKGREYVWDRHRKNKTPTFIIQGNQDKLFYNEQGFYIQELGERFYFVDNADHSFMNREDRAEAIEVACDWFDENL